MLQKQLLATKSKRAFGGRRIAGVLDDPDDRSLIRKRGRRALDAHARSRPVHQAADRPPIAYQRACSAHGTAAALRGRKGFQRMPRGDKARLGLGRSRSTRQRTDSGGETYKVKTLALECFRSALQPFVHRPFRGPLER